MKRKKRQSRLESSNDTEYDENKYLFSSSDLKHFIDHLLGKSYEISINFDSLKALCNRTDSLNDRIFLINAELPKTKNNPDSIEESPVHYVVTNNMLNHINLKILIERQAPEFHFLLNASSFKIISDRKNLDLTRVVVERGKFVRQDGDQTPIDILLQERRDYSNQFIRQLIKDRKENATLFQHRLNDSGSLDPLFKRNDFKLVELLLFHSNFTTDHFYMIKVVPKFLHAKKTMT
jgi:hypothetical protein